jgi:competence protein ComEC
LLVVPLALASPPLAAAAGWVAHLGAGGLVSSADLVRFVPALTYRVAPASLAVVIVYYVAVATSWVLMTHRVAFRVAASVAVAAALWILMDPGTIAASRGDSRLHVTFIDVGQGDAVFVRFPRGSTLLVDAGGLAFTSSFDIGDRVVAPVLRNAGLRRIDSVAVTHGDLDHIGGAAAIVREFHPIDLWEGIPVPPLAVRRTLADTARQSGARWTNVQTGDVVTIDTVPVVVRHPRLPDWERQDVRNDDSIVLELLWHDVSIVLTGDIGREVEREIGPLFAPSHLRVMKVPHHGSLTSSSREFLQALAPRIAVVSVGRGNTFGHPAQEVLERYREVGAHVFRTDQDGAVTVDTDGHSLDVRTFTGQRLMVR